MKALAGFVRFVTAAIFSLAMGGIEVLMIFVDRRRGRIFHRLARFWARGVLLICNVRLRVRGLEKIDVTRNCVYVSNHASMLDIPAIVAGIPGQIRIVYKKELEIIPFFGWGLRWGAYIGIDRGRGARAMRSIEEAVAKIKNGASILLYAEGTRTLDGKLQPFKRGAFNIALRAGVPVVPLTVNGSLNILPKHSACVRPGVVELVLASPIDVAGREGKEAELRLMDQVHAAIARHYIDQKPVRGSPAQEVHDG